MKHLFNNQWYFCERPLTEEFELKLANEMKLEWQSIRVPHDWLIEDVKQLYRDSEGWYRKAFEIEEQESKTVILEFDGIYMESEIYLNGKKIAEWKNGYTNQVINISPYLKNGPNELFVRVTHQSPNSRWYSGAGIYRNIWLYELAKIYIAPHDCYIQPCLIEQTKNTWQLEIDTLIQNPALEKRPVQLIQRLWNEEKQLIASLEQQLICSSGEEKVRQRLEVADPLRWSPQNPNLYRLETLLLVSGKEQKIMNEVGFRELVLDKNRGLLLNGEHFKLQGVCQHHDLGALGSAENPVALKRQLLLLKRMGVNSIRTAHNPFSQEFMKLTDRLGFLVQSEFTDIWKHPKNEHDYARFFEEWAERDVASWVKRDRNHPSLFMWSIGNEIYDTHGREDGVETTQQMIEWVSAYDYLRNGFITFGSNYLLWEPTQKAAELLDAVGYNYGEALYQEHHLKHPDWIIYGSETCSVAQSRGVYHFPLKQQVLADDDRQCSALGNSRTSWGAASVEACILGERETEFSLGQFIWTGFDYIGEPTPYNTKSSYLGQIDTAGFPKDAYYLFQAAWTSYQDAPMIHIFPYWDFSEGQLIDIRICSNAPELELFFNGQSLGRRQNDLQKSKHLLHDWQLPYTAGNLTAVAYDEQGNEIARAVEASFGDTTELVLYSEQTVLTANSEELVFVEVSGLDKEGHPVKNANDRIHVEMSGPVRLAGIDNGDSTDYDSYQGNSKRLFNGKLLLMIAAGALPGEASIRVKSKGLPDSELRLTVIQGAQAKNSKAEPFQPVATTHAPEKPIRKIQLAYTVQDSGEITIEAVTSPAAADKHPLEWRLTDVKGIDSDAGKLKSSGNTAKLMPVANGEVFVRCGTKNGKEHLDFYSAIRLEFTGLKEPFLNPYQGISGGRYSRSNVELTNGNERGVATLRGEESWVIFDQVDFGRVGANQLTLSLFPLEGNVFSIDIWQGAPYVDTSQLIDTVAYTKGTIWNTYQEETYLLKKSLTGRQTLSFVFRQKVHMKEFSFMEKQRAFTNINILENDFLYGDHFKENTGRLEEIGNNVMIGFDELNFGDKGAASLMVRGYAPSTANAIQLKISDKDSEERFLLAFEPSQNYQNRQFDLEKRIYGRKKVEFIFLPGSNFNFESFQFLSGNTGSQ